MIRIKARGTTRAYFSPMNRLALTLISMILPTLAGVGAVAALVAGFTSTGPILGAAGAGGVLSIPLSLFIAKRMGG